MGIRYDKNGNAHPDDASNLAHAARTFDGDWDAELRALDAPAGSPPVSMRQWLIGPKEGDVQHPTSTSKLEDLHPVVHGSWNNQPNIAGQPAPVVGEQLDIETWSPLGGLGAPHAVRRVLQWLGFPVATRWLTRLSMECVRCDRAYSIEECLRLSGEWNRQPDGTWLCIQFRVAGEPLCIPEASHADWPLLRRNAFAATVFLVWAAGIAFTILRSTS